MNVRSGAVSIVSLCLLVAAGQSVHAAQEALLNVSQGQIPNDTGSDGATKMTIEDSADLGGKALKVVFAPNDSFGDRMARVPNWKPFIALQCEVFNPAKENVRLTLTVRHRRTTSFQTRVDMPVALKPGKNSVKLGIDEMLNVNGTAPDLAEVTKWYFACEDGKARTLWFGDVLLVGSDSAPAGTAANLPAAAATGPPVAYKITGRIGEMRVDLTATPDAEATASQAGASAANATNPTALAAARPATPRATRRLPSMPPIHKPVLFNTPEADAICAALQVFPADNPWNQDVSGWPLHPNSKQIIASIGANKPLRGNRDMTFVLVPPDQKQIDVKMGEYSAESDKGPYPVPDVMPIEGWPACTQDDPKARSLTLDDMQRDRLKEGGDRHAIVVDPVNRMLYEFYTARKTDAGWLVAGAAIFDLKSNKLRPDGWTSTDAAGLPIFPAIVRYDELQRGAIEHALRVTVVKTRRAYVAPATHFASRLEDPNLPRMGERIRLRQDFDTSGFSKPVQIILNGLKRYGMFVADNGLDWALSISGDTRIPPLHDELRKVKGSDFEVVVPGR